jgi:hypothetical protein
MPGFKRLFFFGMYIGLFFAPAFCGEIPKPMAEIAKKANLILSVPKGDLDSGLARYLESRKDISDPFSVIVGGNNSIYFWKNGELHTWMFTGD